jgi:hypothetical protein
MGKLSRTLLNSRDGYLYFIINPLVERIGTKKAPFGTWVERQEVINQVAFFWRQ